MTFVRIREFYYYIFAQKNTPIMKKLILAFGLFAFSAPLFAQDSTTAKIKSELAEFQQLFGQDKKALVAEAIVLTPDQATKFWPLYEAYQVSRKKIGEDRIMAIKNYADNYSKMTDTKANEIAEQFLKGNEDLNKLYRDYLKKISKDVSPSKAIQYIQLESYIDNQLKAAVADELPFFPDVKK